MTDLPLAFAYRKRFESLTDAEFGRLIRAALLYAETVEPPAEMTDRVSIAFGILREDVDAAAERAEKRSAVYRNNAEKRWQKTKAGCNSMQPDAIACNSMQSHATVSNCIDNNNINNNIDLSLSEKEKEKNKKNKEFFIAPTVEDVQSFIREAGINNVDPRTFVNYYEARGWTVGKRQMTDWKAAVRYWSRNDKSQNRAAKTETLPPAEDAEEWAATLTRLAENNARMIREKTQMKEETETHV